MPYNQTYGYPAYTPFSAPVNIQSGTNDIQGVRWVSSIDEVKASSVPYGMRSMFMDSKDQIFYIKDYNGNVQSFSFEKIEPPTPDNFVTRQEFDDLRSKYESLVQQYTAATQSQPATIQPTVQPATGTSGDPELSGNTGASQTAVYPDSSGLGNDQGSAQQFA